MEECQHFSIRGAVAEFRKRDWKLNYPFAIHQELNLQQTNSLLSDPLDTPKFKWWCCKSCIQNLIDGDCPHLLAKPATSSYDELVTCKDGSDADAVIFNTSVAIDTDSSALPPTCSNDKYLDEYEGLQTSAVGCSTDSGLLITKKRRVMLDLNEAPPLESSENTFDIDCPVTEELEFESTKSQIIELCPPHNQHTENTETPDAFPEVISNMGNSDQCRSLCTETNDSFKDSVDKVSLKRDNPKMKRIQKYRTISELLNCKSRANLENCQSIRSMEIAPELKPFKKTKLQRIETKKHMGIHVEQGPTLSSTSKDATGKNVKNRAVAEFNLPVENNDFLLGDESLQQLRVSLRKRKQRESPARDDTSEKGNSCPQNESGNLLLPKKKRILGYEVSKVHGHIEKSIQLESVAVKRKKTPSCPSSHKRFKHDSTVRDANKWIPIAQKKTKSYSDGSGSATDTEPWTPDKRISKVGKGSVLLGRPNPNLAGMHLLSLAAEQTKDLDLLSPNVVSRAIPHLYTVREKINIPKYTTDQLKHDVLPTGGKGRCSQATVPSEHDLIDEAMKFFTLGPENLPFRSRRISYN